MTNEELVTLIQAARSDTNAAEDVERYMVTLYEQNHTLIKDIAKKFLAAAELDDLMQEAYIGLCSAVDNYDPAAGVLFMTYSPYWIRQQLQRYCENNGRTIRLPSHRVQQIAQYRKAISAYTVAHGSEPTDAELAAMLDVSMDALARIRAAADMTASSLDAPCGNDESDNITLGDTIADPAEQVNAAIDNIQNAELAATIWPLVDSLPPLQADVIKKSFIDETPLTDIAQQNGVSYGRAAKAKYYALNTLSRYRRRLLPFLEDSIAYSEGIRHIGAATFQRTNESTTERAAFKLLRMQEDPPAEMPTH